MENDVIANLKSLGIDMISKAESGHPGIVLSSAPIIYTVYANHMHININDPYYINRDRFVMSAGHGSALLYATLFMCGFLTLDDLKKFRTIDSKTPGHPEYKVTPGVDASTGPLGQGIGMAVGMAIAEKHLQTLTDNLVDYNIYALCGDGDLMEGISYEAASLAGTLKLNNLIILYDSNRISLDGEINHTFTEDVLTRFEALGWQVFSVSNKVSEIDKAIKKAKRSEMPVLIEVKTILGDGSLLENTNTVHGKPLTKEDIKQLKQKLNVPLEEFYVNEKAVNYFKKKIVKRSMEKYLNWQKLYNDYNISKPDGYLTKFLNKDINTSFNDITIDIPKEMATRDSNQTVMNYFSEKNLLLFGGSADLASSTKVYLNNEGDFSSNTYQGRNIWYGVREHAMGSISNGLALSGFLPFCSTFLVFSDYLKPAIRMSALMDLPVTYIFTHDSINVGEDGPTHEPIEELSMLRSIPNFTVYRPADFNEVVGSWQSILSLKKPSALILSRAKTYNLEVTKRESVKCGAYIVRKESQKLSAILVATGTEVNTAFKIAEDLMEAGYDLRVVSMPSVELFKKQPKTYKYEILPVGIKTFFIEASSSFGLRDFVSNEKYLITLNEFGASGKSEDVLKKFHFDYDSIKNKIKELL